MTNKKPLRQDHKLTVTVRVEPGCLGPDGDAHIEAFCRFAQGALEGIDALFVHWLFVPRHDKSLPETQYEVSGKKLSVAMATRYLELFGRRFDDFEEHIHERLGELVEQYMGR